MHNCTIAQCGTNNGDSNSMKQMATYLVFAMDAFFDVAMSEQKAMTWAGLLASTYSLDEVKAAIRNYCANNGAFRPTLGALVQYLEQGRKAAKEDAKPDCRIMALQAWNKVLEAVPTNGRDNEPRWDANINWALKLAGGWEKLCLSDEFGLAQIRKTFVDEYEKLAQRQTDEINLALAFSAADIAAERRRMIEEDRQAEMETEREF